MDTRLTNRNILISGASIAGPALAYWLKKYGFNVTIIEKAPELRSGGYRIDLRGVAIDIAEKMGIMPDIRNACTAMRGSSMVNGKGKRLVNLDDPNIFGMRQTNDTEIMRGDLSCILYEATKSEVEYIFNDSIAAITQTTEQVNVTFRNSPPRIFDLVVAADGLRSNVRKLAFNDSVVSVKDLGYYVSIFTIPNYFGLDHWELSYPSAGRIINVYSTGKCNEAKVFLMFASDTINYDYHDIEQQKQIVADHFRGVDWEVPKMLELMKNASDLFFDSVSQVHMNSLANGRVVLLGDAGYCASPASGQGTSLALTGAYVLAGELAASRGDHDMAFKNYQLEMAGFIKKNQALGREVLKEMVPKSKTHVWFQNNMLRLLLLLPNREKIFKSFLKEMQQHVNEAANAIIIKDYKEI